MKRDAMIARLDDRSERWDVIVIGGGATGLGTALDAASRGFRTLLLEQNDFAKGTSSRSTKLIHGGVRYLRRGNIKLVSESLHERGLLLNNAPHLVHPLAFVVPAYHFGETLFYGAGLKMYDLLAGPLGIEASRLLGRTETLHRLPGLNPSGLRGGVLYFDAQFDDARLAITLAQTFADLDGAPVNYTGVASLLKRDGKVRGVVARDFESGREFEIESRVIINATGVFADAIRKMDEPSGNSLLAPSQGVHVVVDKSFLPGDAAIMVPKTEDERVLFAIPWHDHVLIGTTDTPVSETSMEPRAFDEEVEFLLKHAARYLANAPAREDVLSVFAGLRPLVKAGEAKRTSKLPRDHVIEISAGGMVTITGGKWTTYRKMGEDAIDAACEVAGLERRASRTESLRLHGWTDRRDVSVFGADADSFDQFVVENSELGERLHPNLANRGCEVVWAARHEMARTVEDVLARRTRALFLNANASIEAAPRVAQLMAGELGRDGRWQSEQVAHFRKLANGYTLFRR